MSCPTGLQDYTPNSVLNTLAGSIPDGGSVLDIVDGADFNNFDIIGELTKPAFLTAVIAPPAAIIVMFVLLSCSVCCAKKVCMNCCKGDSVIGLIIFLFFCTMSAIGWFMSIGATAQVIAGVSGALDGVDCGFDVADALIAEIDNVIAVVTDAGADAESTATLCADALSLAPNGSGFDTILPAIPNISDFVQPLIEPFEAIESTVGDLESQVTDILDTIRPYMDLYNSIFLIFACSVIVIIGVFAFTTAVGVLRVLGRHDFLDNHPRIGQIAYVLRRFSSCLVFGVGSIILFGSVIILVILTLFVFAGSELCVPDPTDTLIDLASSVLSSQGTIPDGTSVCDDSTYAPICYFATCTGSNPLDTEIDPIINDLNSSIFDLTETVLDEITTQLDAVNDAFDALLANFTDFGVTSCSVANVADCGGSCAPFETEANNLCVLNSTALPFLQGVTTCSSSTATLIGETDTFIPLAENVLDFMDCSAVTPVYQKIFEDAFCNNLVAGFALTYVSLNLAVFSLLCAMFVFRLMNLQLYEDDEKMPVAQKVSV